MALNIHEERIWRLNESLEFVLFLFVFSRWVKEIDGESLYFRYYKVSLCHLEVCTTLTDHLGCFGAMEDELVDGPCVD
jgi:hypothetical protein